MFNPTRRQFAAFGSVAALWSGSAGAATLTNTASPAKAASHNVQRQGNLFQPETGEHPGLVMFASAAASRSANAAVAQQLASQGLAVLLVEAPVTDDPDRVIHDARVHIDWLVSQSGVAAESGQRKRFEPWLYAAQFLRRTACAQPGQSRAKACGVRQWSVVRRPSSGVCQAERKPERSGARAAPIVCLTLTANGADHRNAGLIGITGRNKAKPTI